MLHPLLENIEDAGVPSLSSIVPKKHGCATKEELGTFQTGVKKCPESVLDCASKRFGNQIEKFMLKIAIIIGSRPLNTLFDQVIAWGGALKHFRKNVLRTTPHN
jgi:hypothetical protein